MIRNVEEGDRPAPAVADRAGAGARVIARCRVKDPSREQESPPPAPCPVPRAPKKARERGRRKAVLRELPAGVASQAKKLREKAGCDEVELRVVVEDRKVQLKARPGR